MFLLKLLSRLPFWFMYGIAAFLAFLMNSVAGYRKQVILNNMRKAFPDKSEKELKQLCGRFYHNLSQVFVESLKALTMSLSEMQRRVTIINQPEVKKYLDKGQSIVVLASHQSNWEWLLLGNQAHLMGYQVDAGYKPLRNGFSDRLFKTIRTRFGSNLIASAQILRQMVARRKIVRPVALVADQRPAPESAYWTIFFNQPTGFLLGSDRLPKMMNYPVFFTEMARVRRGHYTIRFHKLAEPPYDNQPDGSIIEAYAQAVEAAIKRNPADWLWSHKRWKHNPPEGVTVNQANR